MCRNFETPESEGPEWSASPRTLRWATTSVLRVPASFFLNGQRMPDWRITTTGIPPKIDVDRTIAMWEQILGVEALSSRNETEDGPDPSTESPSPESPGPESPSPESPGTNQP